MRARKFPFQFFTEASVDLAGCPDLIDGMVAAIREALDQMDFELIGTMTSKYFPPLAMMNKGVINEPVGFFSTATSQTGRGSPTTTVATAR